MAIPWYQTDDTPPFSTRVNTWGRDEIPPGPVYPWEDGPLARKIKKIRESKKHPPTMWDKILSPDY